MHAPSPQELLRIWERGHDLAPAQQALLLLEGACPGRTRAGLEALTAGQCSGYLLDLHDLLFGPDCTSEMNCSSCGTRTEVVLTADEMRKEMREPGTVHQEILSIQAVDYQVQFRLPVLGDLAAMDPGIEDSDPFAGLLQRCVVAARKGSVEVEPSHLPRQVLQAVQEAIGSADPGTVFSIAFTCPACGSQEEVQFDITHFLWKKIEQQVHRARES
jgi:hypothetical protein